MNRQHPFSKKVLGQRTSPFLQEKLIVLGCEEVFGKVPVRVSELLGIDVSESRVYRSCQRAAAALPEAAVSAPGEELSALTSDACREVYGMVDGSMLFTDEGWQETKLGRVFSCRPVDKGACKWEMEHTQYVAKRGHYGQFVTRFEQLLPPQSPCSKIFVTDGAAWIGQWIGQRYPTAVHILDFFHVCEKIAEVVPPEPGWLQQQKDDLLEGRADRVIERLEKMPPDQKTEKVLTYLKNHRDKMDYGEYRRNGWMIGSGPIESAHRTVLQVRMKRSGVRWANQGCDNMIKLRLVYKNNQTNLIRELLKAAA